MYCMKQIPKYPPPPPPPQIYLPAIFIFRPLQETNNYFKHNRIISSSYSVCFRATTQQLPPSTSLSILSAVTLTSRSASMRNSIRCSVSIGGSTKQEKYLDPYEPWKIIPCPYEPLVHFRNFYKFTSPELIQVKNLYKPGTCTILDPWKKGSNKPGSLPLEYCWLQSWQVWHRP